MKKNITINLLGRLYQIDEDAYQLLQSYMEALRNYFRNQESGEEIVDDIEARIAELFDELKASGTEAISIENVQDIMQRIGNPEQMTGDSEAGADGQNGGGEAASGTASDAGEKSEFKEKMEAFSEKLSNAVTGKKKLYRDPSNKMLSGLLAGMANYFGGDVTFWRVGYVLLIVLCHGFISVLEEHLFFSIWPLSHLPLFLILAYIVLSIIVPSAQTPEDKLKMQGKQVNPQNLAEVMTEESKAAAAPPAHGSAAGGCLSAGLKIFGILMGVLLMIPLTFVIVVLILFVCSSGGESFLSLLDLTNEPGGLLVSAHKEMVFFLIVAGLAFFLIPLYCIIHAILSSSSKTKPMGIWQRMLWLLTWMLSLGTIIACSIMLNNLSVKYYFNSGYSDDDGWDDTDSIEVVEQAPDTLMVETDSVAP